MDNSLEDKTIETYNRNADAWAARHAQASDWAWLADRLLHFLPKGKILEIGCGGGRDAAELMERGYGYFGTDASAEMVRIARVGNPGAKFEKLSAYELSGLKQKFDGFWACAVLLHIPKARIDEALQAIQSALHKGAIGVITIKDGDLEDFEVRDKRGLHEERLFVYWTREGFTEALKRNDFEVIDYEYRAVSERTNWHVFIVRAI